MAVDRPLRTPDLPDPLDQLGQGEMEVEFDTSGVDLESPDLEGLDLAGLDSPEVEAAAPALIPHEANLAEYMSEDGRRKLTSDLKLWAENDENSRSEWRQQMDHGLKLLGFTFESVTEPWPGAAAATHPLLAKAVVSFQSRSIKSLFPPSGPVKGKVRGKLTPFKLGAMRRVVNELNATLTKHQDYRDELEKALFMCGLTGSGFVKTWHSAPHRRPLSYSANPKDVILSPDAVNVYTAMRVTHVLRRTLADITYDQSTGMYRQCDLEEGDPTSGTPAPDASTELDDTKDEISGIDGSKDQRLVLHEMQTRLRLADYDKNMGAYDDPDWGALPYIVTYDTASGELLGLYRNWSAEDLHRMPLQRFTQYTYLVSDLSPYGIGLVHLIGQTTESTTAALRSLLDAGTLANLPGGFKTRGLRVKNETRGFKPGEYRDVDVASGTLRDNLLPHQFKEPSQTLLALMEGMNQKGEELATVASASLDDIPHNAASFAVLAVLERELEPQAAVHVRLHAAFKYQLQLFTTLLRENLYPQEPSYDYDLQDGDGAQQGLRATDFALAEISPVSNPNEASAGAKLLKMQVLQGLAGQYPQQFDEAQLVRYAVSLLGEPDFDALMKAPEDPPPLDPLSENTHLLLGKPVKVYLEQDHEAHLRVHMAAMQDPKLQQIVQQSSQAQALMMAAQAHLAEHVAYAYRRSIEREMGIPLPPPGQPLPLDQQNQLANLTAEAAERVLGLHMKLENLKKAEDPVVQAQILDAQNKARQLDIEEENKRRINDREDMRLQLDARAKGMELTFKGFDVAIKALNDGAKIEGADADRANRSAAAQRKDALPPPPVAPPPPPPPPPPAIPPELLTAMTTMATAVAAGASKPAAAPTAAPAAPNITVHVPKQDAPVVNVDVKVPPVPPLPSTAPPVINVTAPVSVEMPHPTAMDQLVERDEDGNIKRTSTTYTLPPRKPK
jgi:hypothetical protein